MSGTPYRSLRSLTGPLLLGCLLLAGHAGCDGSSDGIDAGGPGTDAGPRADAGSTTPPGTFEYPDGRCGNWGHCGTDQASMTVGLQDVCVCRHVNFPDSGGAERCTGGLGFYTGPMNWGYCGRWYCRTNADCSDLGFTCNDVLSEGGSRLRARDAAPGADCDSVCGGCGWCGPREETESDNIVECP